MTVEKNLNRWFKEKWVDVSRTGKDGKHPPCGRSKAKKGSKGYPKCRPSVKVSSKTPKTSGSMSSGQKRAATKRKRSKKQGVGGKPTIVKSEDDRRYGESLEDYQHRTMHGYPCKFCNSGRVAQHNAWFPEPRCQECFKEAAEGFLPSIDEMHRQLNQPQFNTNWQDINTGEPMDIAFQLLKDEKTYGG